MSKKIFLMLLVFISCSIHVIAQPDYYYNEHGEKIPLTLIEGKVLVSVPIDCSPVSERIRANVQAIYYSPNTEFFYFYITRADLEKLTSLDFWEEDSKSVIITPCFYRDDWAKFGENYREAFVTPHLMVYLKKEGDIDLLTPYLEKYKLKIARDWSSDPRMRFSCILYVTLESEKSSIECANELYESGDFAASFPDFGIPGSGADAIRTITTATADPSSEIYDLHGRKLTSKPTGGIYILQGQKKLAESR